MSMQEVINSVQPGAFEKCMNLPEDGWDGIADVKIFPDLSHWAVCPLLWQEGNKDSAGYKDT